jgi:hypothetical protein
MLSPPPANGGRRCDDQAYRAAHPRAVGLIAAAVGQLGVLVVVIAVMLVVENLVTSPV